MDRIFSDGPYAKHTERGVMQSFLKSVEYGRKVGVFFSYINGSNILELYQCINMPYIESFWELINNQQIYKKIPKSIFKNILVNTPFLINFITLFKNLTNYYDSEIRFLLLNNSKSAELLLSVYVERRYINKKERFLPNILSDLDKEDIIKSYLNSNQTNLNYLKLIENIGNESNFRISDKTRLIAKNLLLNEKKKFLNKNNGIGFGVSIDFSKNSELLIQVNIDEKNIINYTYSLDYIENNNDRYSLFKNFKNLFKFTDHQNRITLFSKKSKLSSIESHLGIRAKKEYQTGINFNINHIYSQMVIFKYNEIINKFNTNIEGIIEFIFTSSFQKKYGFVTNASFNIPFQTKSYFEKVRLIAPEFESILKQFKIFVEEGEINYELLQISSSPTAIEDIPSLNENKYFYLNTRNDEAVNISTLFFSDQALLTCVEPFIDKDYSNFFDLLQNEQVLFNNYENYLKFRINYLIDKNFIKVDEYGYIEIINRKRVLLLKDLYENEFSSLYRYPADFQKEVHQMASKEIVCFKSTLFSQSEQSYFNYFLNKKEFTNGLDIRNRYVHGTQPNPNENETHKDAYFIYLKLIILTMLKIEDDLQIWSQLRKKEL